MATKSNSNLANAKKVKNDEFYTQLTDIEKEMRFYKDFFKNKVVYCNCDDARESNFFKYFSLNFEFLGLKKLISTGYKENGKGVVLIYEGDKNGNRKVDDHEIQVSELNGNGDFRSAECIEFLKQADVVVTNPPFSLFREYVKQLMEFGKKFLVVGSMNAITYKEIFPNIKNNELWLGMTWIKEFIQPNKEIKKFGNICWFTNIEHNRRNQPLDLYKKYSNEDYPKYDNYDAIECGRMENLPIDYNGIIGVPITGLKHLWSDGKIHVKINGEDVQFEIVKFRKGDDDKDLSVNGKPTYARILIKRKQY